jgi:hypothetical protein
MPSGFSLNIPLAFTSLRVIEEVIDMLLIEEPLTVIRGHHRLTTTVM